MLQVSAALSLTRAMGVVLVMAAAWPSHGHGFVGPGLDPSWQDGLRAAFDQGAVFGRDLVFTHGPLGFLVTRVPPASLSWTLAAVDALLVVLSAWLAWRLGREPRGPALQWLLAAALLSTSPFLGGMDLPMAASWLGLACVAAGARTQSPGRLADAPLAVAGAALASLTFLIKANTGLVVPELAAGWLAWRAWVSGRPRLAVAAAALPLAVAAVAVLALPVDVVGLIRWAPRLAAGYQDSQYLPFTEGIVRRAWGVSLAAVGVMVLAGAVSLLRRRDTGDLLPVVTASVLALLAIKQGFVRADAGHVAMGLRSLPGAALVMAAGASTALRQPALAAGAVVVGLTWALQMPHPLAHPRAHLAAVRGYAHALSQGDAGQADIRHVPRLPAGVVAALSGRSVDVLSPDLTLVTREAGIRWQPRPTLQGYVATHPALDELNAAHFLSPRAPDVLLQATFGTCVDDRCWVDEPRTREAVWRAYAPVGRAGDLQLLVRRRPPVPLVETRLSSPAWSLGRPLALPAPAPGERLRVRLRVAMTPLAALQRLALRPPALELRLAGALGDRRLRVWPSLLEQGLLLSPVADSPDGLLDEAAGVLDRLVQPSSATVTASEGWGYVAVGPADVIRLVRTPAPAAAVDRLATVLDTGAPVSVRAWRDAESCAAGHVDRWPSGEQPMVGGWAVVPSSARPADRVLFTLAAAPPSARAVAAVALTLRWRPDVPELTGTGAALLSGFGRLAWWPPQAPITARQVEAWAYDASSGDAWRLCWAVAR